MTCTVHTRCTLNPYITGAALIHRRHDATIAPVSRATLLPHSWLHLCRCVAHADILLLRQPASCHTSTGRQLSGSLDSVLVLFAGKPKDVARKTVVDLGFVANVLKEVRLLL